MGEMAMAIRYGCFFSYAHGRHALMNRFKTALADALAAVREPWEPETTARNLRLIREARERRGDAPSWADEIENELTRRVKG